MMTAAAINHIALRQDFGPLSIYTRAILIFGFQTVRWTPFETKDACKDPSSTLMTAQTLTLPFPKQTHISVLIAHMNLLLGWTLWENTSHTADAGHLLRQKLMASALWYPKWPRCPALSGRNSMWLKTVFREVLLEKSEG